MFIKSRFAMAGAFAFVLLASGAAAPNSASHSTTAAATQVAVPQAADMTSTAHTAVAAQLTAVQMSAIYGDGFFSKIWKAIKKVAKWVWNNWEKIQKVIEVIIEIIDIFRTEDANLSEDVTEHHENEVTVDEYYDSDASLNAGSAWGYDQTETGMRHVYTEYSGGGGGGGGGCEWDCQPMMY